jgi:hypothetical protein
MQGSTERLLTMDTGYDRSDLELVSRHRPDDAALDPETVGHYRRGENCGGRLT